MSRGFVGGLFWGGIVAALGLGVVSQVAPLPHGNANWAPVPPPEPRPADATPKVDGGEVATTDTAPSTAPEPVPAAPATEIEPPSSTGQGLATAPDEPMAEEPAVASDMDGDVATEPAPQIAVPPQPDSAPAAPAAPQIEPGPQPNARADLGPDPAQVAVPPAISTEEPGPAAVDPPPPAPQDEALLAPATQDPPPAPAEIAPAEVPPAEPETAPEPEPEAAATALPEPIVPDAALPPVTGRLPRIGDAAPVAEEPVPELRSDAPPVERFARTFDNPDKKPAFGILLIDTGGPQIDREQLAALPFPVTFLIDPQAPDAAAAQAIYRAAGQEVAMLATGIPAGATAADLEQTFQANAAILPEAVAVADLAAGGFQDDRVLAGQVVPVVKAQGRGLVTFDRGLNAADQVARREDVPAALIFRRLDGEGEAAPVIRRYLDRAAFKAAQEGRVAVLGETRPETIAALLEWTVEGRAAQVALAPLTAVMSVE